MTLIHILAGFLFALRRHLRRTLLARYATRPQLLTLDIVFREIRLSTIDGLFGHALSYSIRAFIFRSSIRFAASSLEVTSSDQSSTRASLLNLFSSANCSWVGFSVMGSSSQPNNGLRCAPFPSPDPRRAEAVSSSRKSPTRSNT